jgi:AraC family transcriptional regulator
MEKRKSVSMAGVSAWWTPPLQRREAYEGQTRLLGEVPLIGRLDLRETVRHALPAHRHAGMYEVHFVHAGSLEMWIDAPELAHAVRGGMAILTRPGQLHGGVRELLNPARFSWLQVLVPARPDRPLPGLSVRQTRALLESLTAVRPPVFRYSPATEDCFVRLFEEHRRRRPDSEVMARSILHELIALLGREYGAGPASSARLDEEGLSPPVRKALRWLHENLGEEAGVARMAGVAGMSDRHFRARFHREMGYTPADYVTRRRVERAREWLQETDRSVTDIALELGFSTPAYFAAVFRKHTGQTPRDCRARPSSCPTSNSTDLTTTSGSAAGSRPA